MFFRAVDIVFPLLVLFSPVLATPEPKTIHQFSNPTWVENILATRNGSLLVSLFARPEVHLIHPFDTPPTSSLVYSFPDANSVSGITELAPDVFAITTNNFSIAEFAPTLGSSSVWKVDLTTPKTTAKSAPKVEKIADIPNAQFLNGAAALNEHTVYLADCVAGNIVKLDTHKGTYSVIINDTSMTIPTGVTGAFGVNGVKVNAGYLYYSNTAQNTLNRVKVSPITGAAIGSFEKIGELNIPDDFVVLEDGTAFVAQPYENIVSRVDIDGKVTKVAGNLNSSAIAGITSVTIGRTWRDRDTIYMSTTGAITNPVNGTYTEGGKVVALKLR